MKYCIVSFNVETENALHYRKYKTLKGTVKGFSEILEDSKVQFISVRKIQESSDIPEIPGKIISPLEGFFTKEGKEVRK